MKAKRVLLAVVAAMVLLVGGSVAYANNRSGDEEDDGSYRGSIAAPQHDAPSLQRLAGIDRTAAEQAALKVVPGTVLETELEADDNGYVVYDVEVAGNDGKSHDVKVDAGNGEILDQGLEEDFDEADEAAETEDADEPGDSEDADEPSETEDTN